MGYDSQPSLAGSYLLHALGEFRSAGSPEALYRELEPWYQSSLILGPMQRRISAADRRLGYLRATVMMTAFAAEGYANEFLAARLAGRALEGADRLPTVDKLVLGPRFAGLEPPISYDREPGTSLIALFKARDLLVHPSPQEGAYAIELSRDTKRPYDPSCAARYLIEVSHAAMLLHPLREDNSFPMPASRIWEERSVLENHVKEIGGGLLELPKEDAEPVRDLMAQMHDRAAAKARRNKRHRDSGTLGTEG